MKDNTRIRVLKYIEEHQPVAVTKMSVELKISIGSVYHHLGRLRTFVSQDQNKRYRISDEGKAFLQGEIPEPINRRRFYDVSVYVDESLSKYHTRGRLLRFIAQNGSVSIKQIKENLKMSVGSIYHHLSKLENLLEQDEYGRYRLSNEALPLTGAEAEQEQHERDKQKHVPIEIPKDILELKTEHQFIPTRVAILKFLYENPDSTIPKIKDSLNVDMNSVKKHLKRLPRYITADRYDRYRLAPLGVSLLARYQENCGDLQVSA